MKTLAELTVEYGDIVARVICSERRVALAEAVLALEARAARYRLADVLPAGGAIMDCADLVRAMVSHA